MINKLAEVQKELKAPKGQFNSFGKYKYRSQEDILEAAKPLCIEKGLVLSLSDDLILLGNRFYVKATATVTDIESKESFSVTGFARESETKKGMDDSQITGTASSYARKYALNGLFCIDDTKDADTDEHKNTIINTPIEKAPKATKKQLEVVVATAKRKGISDDDLDLFCSKKYDHDFADIDQLQYTELLTYIQSKPNKE